MVSLGSLPALQVTPGIDAESILRGFQQGAENQILTNQRSLLRSAGGQAASGDTRGAAASLLRGGEIGAGIKLQDLDDERKLKVISLVKDYAARAETPEQWAAFINTLKKNFGADSVGEFESFEARPQALTLLEQIDAAIKQKQLTAPESDVGKLKADKEAGLLTPEEYDAAFAKKTKGGGGITFTTAGGDTIEIGGEAPLTKPATSGVQERAINAAELGSRLAAIAADFKPEYLTVGRRLQNMWQSGLAKLDPKSLNEGDRKAMAEFATFKSRAYDNLNQLLKELSGAAVTPQEFERLKVSLPNPGTGIFDGDDPVTFEAKLNRASADANAALARYRFYQATGIPNSLDEIPLSDVKNVNGQWAIKKNGKVYLLGALKPAQAQ